VKSCGRKAGTAGPATQAVVTPRNYRNHLRRSFPPSFFGWFSSLLVEPGNELLRFLAEKLSIPQRAIVLERGERSRHKVIGVDDLSEQDIRRGLLELS